MVLAAVLLGSAACAADLPAGTEAPGRPAGLPDGDAGSDSADSGAASPPVSAIDATGDASHDGLDGGLAEAGASGLADAAPDAARPARMCGPPPSVDQPIVRLSETGCVDPDRPLRPAPGLIYYEVSSPLWSDGAGKERWAFIPPGQKIRIKDCRRQPAACQDPELGTGGTAWDPGHFELPVGSVLVKHFSIGARRIETRLITRLADAWGTYSYRWNDDQSDAVVIGPDEGAVSAEFPNPTLNPANDPAVTRAPAGRQVWTYPGRGDCLRCHTDEAGFQLGLDLLQLDAVITYPDGTARNQIDHWQQQGLFEAPPARPLPPALPPPAGAGGSLEQRARSYLHANCAGCHRPGGKFPLMDLRWTTPLARTQTCDVAPDKGDLGVPGARRLVPGAPDRSLLSLRMRTLAERFRMPQLGTAVVDLQGAQVVDAWIASLPPVCPPP
jgi:mono/diheme cytochrome c family protein